jgi:hypothetical protein
MRDIDLKRKKIFVDHTWVEVNYLQIVYFY